MMLAALVLAASLGGAAVPQDSLAPVRTADSLRTVVLKSARFVHLDSTQCNPGVLRTFPDSARAAGAGDPIDAVTRLERLVISEGVEEPIDNARGHALLRGVVGWEAGMVRPNWDVATGRTFGAIAAGMSGSFYNPDTKQCESFVPDEPQYVVLPPLTNFTMPRPPKRELTIGFGAEGLADVRNKFYSAHPTDTASVLTYAHVVATVLWRDYAVVAVNRPAEQMGAVKLRQGVGGTTYLFHFVAGEWRLLAIVRSWT